MGAPLLALLAMLAELATGSPGAVFRVIGHPVTWLGRLISALEGRWNRGSDRRRRRFGVATAVLLALVGLVPGLALERVLPEWGGQLALAVLAGTLIAQRSLGAHVAAVATALERGLPEGRAAVSQIVGRDPESLDAAGVARAAVESLAENFSDGVVAPVFWLWAGGLGAGAAYKAINTGDSMIGHRSDRYRAFGWATARLDDLVNLPASRLTAALLIGAACLTPGASPRGAWDAVRRDAGRHRSPNAGWPEAAMAGALGLALAGPRRYGGELVEDAVMGLGGRRDLGPSDIRRALRLYWTADALLVGFLVLLSLPV